VLLSAVGILLGAKDGLVRLYAGQGEEDARDSEVHQTVASLDLLDLHGKPFELQIGENTMLIAAATWCSASTQLRQWLQDPQLLAQLDGLKMVFVFGDESFAGGGPIYDPTFLDGLPGTVALLAPESPRPAAFPTVYDSQLGQFTDQTAFAAIGAWLDARGLASQAAPPDGPACSHGHTGGQRPANRNDAAEQALDRLLVCRQRVRLGHRLHLRDHHPLLIAAEVAAGKTFPP